jgi:hypothetical protein
MMPGMLRSACAKPLIASAFLPGVIIASSSTAWTAKGVRLAQKMQVGPPTWYLSHLGHQHLAAAAAEDRAAVVRVDLSMRLYE